MNKYAFQLITQFEGCYLTVYEDPIGLPTVGYGHLISKDSPFYGLKIGDTITENQAHELLQQDMSKSLYYVRKICTASLSVKQEGALIDFVFNLGPGNFQSSTLRKKINAGEFCKAADEFPKWVYAAGRKLPGLVRRRQAERLLWLQSLNLSNTA